MALLSHTKRWVSISHLIFSTYIEKTTVKVILGVNYAVEFKFDISLAKQSSLDPELTPRKVTLTENFEVTVNKHDYRGNLPRKIRIWYQFFQLTDGWPQSDPTRYKSDLQVNFKATNKKHKSMLIWPPEFEFDISFFNRPTDDLKMTWPSKKVTFR